jgi:hypothetical protein
MEQTSICLTGASELFHPRKTFVASLLANSAEGT